MQIYDISLTICEAMPVWPGDPAIHLERVRSLHADGVAVARLTIGTHTGTHLDAPAHLLADGLTVEALSLEPLIGPVHVGYLPQATVITAKELEALALPNDCRRLLLKTRNSSEGLLTRATFTQDYTALTDEAANWLADQGYLLVGIDALSVDPYQADVGAAHRILLGRGIVVVEGLDLYAVPPGDYVLCCLPLRILGADGAPARAVLIAP